MRNFGLFAVVTFAASCGCSGSSDLAQSRETAYAAVREGQTAFDARDYATAVAKLAPAVASGMLNVDVYCQATVELAIAYAADGKYDEALAALDKLTAEAPNQAEILAARSFVFKKQGKAREAAAAWQQARKLNPRIKEYQ
jgi:tetratricopeptide (TPR) repeat protein